jgi:hypothetical protein
VKEVKNKNKINNLHGANMKNNNKVSNPAIEKLVSEILSQSDPSEIFGKEGMAPSS